MDAEFPTLIHMILLFELNQRNFPGNLIVTNYLIIILILYSRIFKLTDCLAPRIQYYRNCTTQQVVDEQVSRKRDDIRISCGWKLLRKKLHLARGILRVDDKLARLNAIRCRGCLSSRMYESAYSGPSLFVRYANMRVNTNARRSKQS